MDGQTSEQNSLQRFEFPQPVDADHLELVLKDNWGGTDGIALAEVEIVGQLAAIATPLPAPTLTSTPKPFNVLWSVTNAIGTYTVTATNGDPVNIVATVDIQTCAPDPYTNPWSGTLFEQETDTANGQQVPVQLPLNGVVPRSGPGTIYDDGHGGTLTLGILAGNPPQATFVGRPGGNAVPSVIIKTVPVSVGGACTP
jgi:hypothetical protein